MVIPGSVRGIAARALPITLPIAFILIWSSGYLVGSIGSRAGSPLSLIQARP